jgi:hypothetical protein
VAKKVGVGVEVDGIGGDLLQMLKEIELVAGSTAEHLLELDASDKQKWGQGPDGLFGPGSLFLDLCHWLPGIPARAGRVTSRGI